MGLWPRLRPCNSSYVPQNPRRFRRCSGGSFPFLLLLAQRSMLYGLHVFRRNMKIKLNARLASLRDFKIHLRNLSNFLQCETFLLFVIAGLFRRNSFFISLLSQLCWHPFLLSSSNPESPIMSQARSFRLRMLRLTPSTESSL